MEKENAKYSWESQCEYEYRKETGKIAVEISLALTAIGEVTASKTYDYAEIKEKIDKCYKTVRYMAIPKLYENVHKYLQEALHSYAQALELLVGAAKNTDVEGVHRAGRIIEEGNCFIKITKLRIWMHVEDRIKEDKNVGSIDGAGKVVKLPTG